MEAVERGEELPLQLAATSAESTAVSQTVTRTPASLAVYARRSTMRAISGGTPSRSGGPLVPSPAFT